LQQEAIVRFALHDVADAHKFWIPSQDLQLRPNIGRPQINPADDSKNRGRALGEIEEPASFLERLARLNCNRSLEVIGF